MKERLYRRVQIANGMAVVLLLIAMPFSVSAQRLPIKTCNIAVRLPRDYVNRIVQDVKTRGKTPRFEDFPVPPGEQFKGKPAAVKLTTAQSRRYRTVIREGAKEGPNFAGHYTLVQWGCGAGCVQFAVVDAQTGAVYVPTFYVGPRAQIETDQTDEPLQFRIDSKLLMVSGAPNEKNEGLYYYRWDGKRFVLLNTVPFKK